MDPIKEEATGEDSPLKDEPAIAKTGEGVITSINESAADLEVAEPKWMETTSTKWCIYLMVNQIITMHDI